MIDIGTLLFILCDGGRARLVQRAPDGGGFVTIEEMDNGETLRALKAERAANPATRVFDSVGKGRHGASVGPGQWRHWQGPDQGPGS